jgi:hypothetical protein
VSSAGPEAIDLSASAGLYLDDWQQYVLIHALGEKPDGNWAATEVGLIVPRQNGKGSTLEAMELFNLVLVEETKVILHSAHAFKTCKEAYFRLKALFDSTPDLKRLVKRTYESAAFVSIQLTNGSRIDFVARTNGSGRGLTGDVIVLDEAFALEDRHIEALAPTLLARPNTQIWYTSSPPLSAATGQPLFDLRTRAEDKDDSLAWFDYGQAPDVDLDDPEVWAAANPATSSGRITVEKLARMRKTMSDEGFGREILGIWPATSEGTAIGATQWAAIADPDSRRAGNVAIACDISKMRDYASISVYGIRPDGLGHIQLASYQGGTAWIVPKLVELKAALDPLAIGMGRGTYESLKEDLIVAGIKLPEDADRPGRGDLAVTTPATMAAACGQFIDAVRQRSLRVVPAVQLNEAVAGAKTRITGETMAWAHTSSSAEISPIVAATLARWAYSTRVDAIAETVMPWVIYA